MSGTAYVRLARRALSARIAPLAQIALSSLIILSALILGSLPLPAAAAEVCVTCSGPEAVYRCTIADLSDAANEDPRSQLTCIKSMAMLGGHESCSVRRATPNPCQGLDKTVALPPANPGPAGVTEVPLPAREGGAQTGADQEGPPTEPKPSGLEKAGDAVTSAAKSAGRQIEKAGDAVGGAAKKTWDCMSTLFKDC